MTVAAQRPVALYVHFPFCLSICPYCDFVVYAGRAARGPDNRIDSLVGALVTRDRATRDLGWPASRQRLPRRRHALTDERTAAGHAPVRRGPGVRDRRRRRDHTRGKSGRRRTRRHGRLPSGRRQPAEHRRAILRARGAGSSRAAPLPDGHPRDGCRGTRRRHRQRQPRSALRRARADARVMAGDPRCGCGTRARPHLCLRSVAR